MSVTMHPVLQLADESIRKINKELNYNNLHINSASLKTSMKNKKK